MFNRLSLITLILVASSPALAGTSICAATECILFGSVPAKLPVESDGGTPATFSLGQLWVDGDKVAIFALPDATIVIGDWDGDGTDEPGAYANGYWLLQKDWMATSPQKSVDMTALNPGPTAIPLVGDWQGSGVDGIGLYDNGEFTLYSDIDDLSDSIVIDFGEIPNDTGTAWESMPFVGPVDQVMDRVGLSKGVNVGYAPQNVDATYDFMGQDKKLVTGVLPFRGFGILGLARPNVIDADLLPDAGQSGYILSFRLLPEMGDGGNAECEIYDRHYDCFDGDISKPNESGVVIVPIFNPFQ